MTAERAAAFAEQLARVALGGGGAKAFADFLARELATGVIMEDALGGRMASAGDVPADGRVHNGKPGITAPIALGEEHWGQIALLGPAAPEFAEVAVRLAACALALELAREGSAAPGRQRSFWELLVARNYTDSVSAREAASAYGIPLASHYVAVCLEADGSDEARAGADREELRKLAAAHLHAEQADAGVLDRAGELILLLPAVREIDAANARTAATLLPRAAAKRNAQLRISGGIGEQHPFNSVARSVAQATNALHIGRRIFGSGRVVAYDELGIYPLLFEGAGVQELRAFSTRTLAPLRAYDDKHQTELERTLALYFRVGENVKAAAAELHVHRHTVFYRLRQIAEICSCKLESPHDQLTLRMALAIDALNR